MSQRGRVVITRRGKPAAVLVGVEGKDWDDVVLQTSSRFWKLIEERRKESTLSMKELRARLKKRKKQTLPCWKTIGTFLPRFLSASAGELLQLAIPESLDSAFS